MGSTALPTSDALRTVLNRYSTIDTLDLLFWVTSSGATPRSYDRVLRVALRHLTKHVGAITAQIGSIMAVGPFDSAHIYVQWGGKLPGGDGWSCGFRMAGPPETAVVDSASLLAGVGAALVAYHGHANTFISARALLSEVKVNAVGTDGKYIADTTTQALYSDVPGAASAAGTPANQIALAVSMTTGYSRGAAHRGRFFLPLPVFTVGTDGRIPSANVALLRAQTDVMRAAVNSINANWKMAVFSRKAGAPAHRLITGTQVGLVLDTQRRRRASLLEAYV
jgi:hypothetical protein